MTMSDDIPTSWADQVEEGEHRELPAPKQQVDQDSGTRTITEYKYNDDNKKVKVVKTYKVEKRKVSKSVAKRKSWKKFGLAENDPPGPNPSNTIISEETFMIFVHNKEAQLTEPEDDAISKLKGQKIVSCRICKGDHWTTKCPYKDTLTPLAEALGEDVSGEKKAGDDSTAAGAAAPGPGGPKLGMGGSKYVPPSMRAGAKGRGESMSMKRDEAATIRVTNLSEETRESDLQELFKPFGNISRIYLAKDRYTGASKGFAFVSFHRREDASRAIQGVSGYGYDHLILNVEWAKPSGTN